MIARFQPRPLAGVLGGWLALTAVATVAVADQAATGPATMYLRMPATQIAATVTKLSYDAIATVPQSPNIPLSALPQSVEAMLVVPSGAHGQFRSAGPASRYALWTIVETGSDGTVTRRTAFRDVTISSIRPAGDGTAALRVRFTAASVAVSLPSNAVAKN
jgi:hypothetical protein